MKLVCTTICILLLLPNSASFVEEKDICLEEKIFSEISATKDKLLTVNANIGNRRVMYWEHVVNGYYVKNDSILLQMVGGKIVEYRKNWVENIKTPPIKEIKINDDYYWKMPVIFPDKRSCCWGFYSFYKNLSFPIACWEVRLKDGRTLLYDMEGNIIGEGIPAPTIKGYSLSGYNSPDSPDPWIGFRKSADKWFKKWCNSTISISLPSPGEISLNVRDPEVKFFYEIAHGDSYYFQADRAGSFYSSMMASMDMANRPPMWFAFIGSCHGMTETGPGTFSYAFRKGELNYTVTVGYDHMEECRGWVYALQWQEYMFEKMDEGFTIKDAFLLATSYYPTISPAVKFVGDPNMTVYPPPKLKIYKDYCILGNLDVGEICNTSVRIWNLGSSHLKWMAKEDLPWLEVIPRNGSIEGGGWEDIMIMINTTGLANGNYNGTIHLLSNGGNRTFTVYFSVESKKVPEVEIVKPKRGIYMWNAIKLPFFVPVVIGVIEIEAEVITDGLGINRVDFFIDDKLKFSDKEPPYKWRWEECLGLISKHIIKVIAYDVNGNSGECKERVWKIL